MNTVTTINKTVYEMTPVQQAVYNIVSKELEAITLRKDMNSNMASQEEKQSYQRARGLVQEKSLSISIQIVQAIEKVRKEQRSGN